MTLTVLTDLVLTGIFELWILELTFINSQRALHHWVGISMLTSVTEKSYFQIRWPPLKLAKRIIWKSSDVLLRLPRNISKAALALRIAYYAPTREAVQQQEKVKQTNESPNKLSLAGVQWPANENNNRAKNAIVMRAPRQTCCSRIQRSARLAQCSQLSPTLEKVSWGKNIFAALSVTGHQLGVGFGLCNVFVVVASAIRLGNRENARADRPSTAAVHGRTGKMTNFV